LHNALPDENNASSGQNNALFGENNAFLHKNNAFFQKNNGSSASKIPGNFFPNKVFSTHISLFNYLT